jgi:hypothetical protein
MFKLRRHQYCRWNRTILNKHVADFRGYGLSRVHRQPPVVVSLTSLPRRISDVPICIYSIFKQRFKADHVVLSLSRPEFVNFTVPPHVLEWQNYGLTLNWVDEDIRQYLKLLPVLKAYPESLIITVDDDVFYPSTTVERLVESYETNPQVIHAHRTALAFPRGDSISFSGFGGRNSGSYRRFPKPNIMLVAEGIGAILYPPHIFPSEIFNKSGYQQLTPWHDDMWFFAMRLLTGVSTQIVKKGSSWQCRIHSSSAVPYRGLAFWNWRLKKNGKQVSAVGRAYKLGPRLAKLRIEERTKQGLPQEPWEKRIRNVTGADFSNQDVPLWPRI